jgi:hypothetical protein
VIVTARAYHHLRSLRPDSVTPVLRRHRGVGPTELADNVAFCSLLSSAVTTLARVVLADAEQAVYELDSTLVGSLWRRRWVAVVTLLRTVLHVLERVDRDTSPEMREAIDTAWDRVRAKKPEPIILWGFIVKDRNLLLKEYQFTATQGYNTPFALAAGGPPRAIVVTPQEPRPYRSDTTYTMTGGPFHGRYPREVAAEALQWLHDFLDGIDAAVAADGGTSPRVTTS